MDFSVQHRESTGKGVNRRLRMQGENSGIIYGKDEPIKVQMDTNSALRLILSLHGVKKTINLTVEKESKKLKKTVIIQDYQMSSWGQKLLHVDFREVDSDTVISLKVPIISSGVSLGVKNGGLLQFVRHAVPVKCTVKDVPENICIDISNLDIGNSIHVLDVDYPEGVKPIVTGRNFTLITCGGREQEEEELEEEEEGLEEEQAESEEESE